MIYVSDTFGPSILQGLVKGNKIEIGSRSNNIKKTLESLREYKLNISNKAIIGTLHNMKVDLTNAEEMDGGKKIYPGPGDILYLINPSEAIFKYKDDAMLPDTVKLTLDQLIIVEE